MLGGRPIEQTETVRAQSQNGTEAGSISFVSRLNAQEFESLCTSALADHAKQTCDPFQFTSPYRMSCNSLRVRSRVGAD